MSSAGEFTPPDQAESEGTAAPWGTPAQLTPESASLDAAHSCVTHCMLAEVSKASRQDSSAVDDTSEKPPDMPALADGDPHGSPVPCDGTQPGEATTVSHDAIAYASPRLAPRPLADAPAACSAGDLLEKPPTGETAPVKLRLFERFGAAAQSAHAVCHAPDGPHVPCVPNEINYAPQDLAAMQSFSAPQSTGFQAFLGGGGAAASDGVGQAAAAALPHGAAAAGGLDPGAGAAAAAGPTGASSFDPFASERFCTDDKNEMDMILEAVMNRK
eukprot:TRINITY_DN45682_c0_g1_i1.p1 TRINITY_DN45682_c0_g1~~TRINITY_DN45682_c0_g1_i1.p1  ORF type:complete len:272 (+),score=47.77 TRINITY_DN45682_c0_g1_i1:93-908(+)